MDFSESSTNIAVSQHTTPRVTPSPPAILTTTPGGLENDVIIDENDTGVLRSRGRRRRPGRGRVRMAEDPNNSEEPQTHKTDVASDLLQRHPLSFLEHPSPPPARIRSAKGSFKNLVRKVSEKITSTKKQDHHLKRRARAIRRARDGNVRHKTGSPKIARCGSVRSNRSLHSEPGNIPGTNRTNPNGKPGGALPLSGGDAEAGRGSFSTRDDNQRDGVQLATTKTTVKQSVLNLFQTGKFL